MACIEMQQKIFTEKNLEAMILPRYNIQNCS